MAGTMEFFEPEFLQKLERLRLVAKRLSWSGAKGEHPSSKKGFSLEFSDYRNYQKGDDLRYVDWNIYRRMERLCLKVFLAEEEMNLYLLIDASRSMAEGNPAKIAYAKKAAAALGYIGLKNLDRVGGASFSSDLASTLSLGRGRKQILRLFDFLGGLGCDGETDLKTAARSFSLLFPRPGLVVLLSDLFDPAGCGEGLKEILNHKYELLIIHILDPAEIHPETRGDLCLQDVESGRERKISIDAALGRRFEAELKRYFEEIESFCVGRQIDYVQTETVVPFEDFMLLTLRHTKKVK